MGGDMRISGDPVAPWVRLPAADADAAGAGDIAGRFTWRDPEPVAGQEIYAVQAENDGERLAELAWTRAKEPFFVETAADAHQVDADQRLARAKQHRTGGTRRFGDDVGHGMNAVGPIGRGGARPCPHRFDPSGAQSSRMRRGIVGAEIGFRLDEAA